MTDLELFEKFFNKMNIKYEEKFNSYSKEKRLYISEDNLDYGYGKSIEILFNSDESFRVFSPWGE